MDLSDVFRIFVRRWYVALPILLIAAFFSYSSYSKVEPVYYANSVVSIAPPSQRVSFAEAGKAVDINGLLEVGGPSLLTNMAVIACSDDSVRDRVMQAGGGWGYTIKNFPSPNANAPLPLIMVETTQASAESAKKTVELASQEIDPVFRQLQKNAGVPDSQLVRAIMVKPPQPAMAYPSRTRAALGILAGGLALSVLAAVVTDLVMARRGPRRAIPVAEAVPAATATPLSSMAD